jgi:drug/metabolite transporter (DMT)-like permease
MPVKNLTKGYLFLFLSMLAISNVYIFSKAAMNKMAFAQFGFYWFLFAIVWNVVLFLVRPQLRAEVFVDRNTRIYLPLLGLLEVVSTGLFFYSIKQLENPAVVSFIGNVGPLFVALLGFLFLQERFTRLEFAGVVVTLMGAFIISYKPDFSWIVFFTEGAGLVLLSSFIFAVGTVITKHKIKKIHPWVLSVNRSVFLFLSFSFLMVIMHRSLIISQEGFMNVLAGSLLGPFLAVLAGYYAMQYLEVSKSSVIGSSKSFLILLISYLWFGNLPMISQIIGGIVVILGAILIIVGKQKQ